MSGKGNSGSSGSGTGSNSFTPYEVNNRGTNSQGNSYDNRSQPAGEAYHYSNSDGSYYYKNGDSSTYHNTGSGSTYTSSDGKVSKN